MIYESDMERVRDCRNEIEVAAINGAYGLSAANARAIIGLLDENARLRDALKLLEAGIQAQGREVDRLRGVVEAGKAMLAEFPFVAKSDPAFVALAAALAAVEKEPAANVPVGTAHDECAFAVGRHTHLEDGRVGAAVEKEGK